MEYVERLTHIQKKIKNTVSVSDETDLFYLTGLKRKGVLVIPPARIKKPILFYTQPQNAQTAYWEGATTIPSFLVEKDITTYKKPIRKIEENIIGNMRILKSESELREIRKAITLTKKVIAKIDSTQTPREIKALIEYEFALAGATHAFDPIITNEGNILHNNTYANTQSSGALLIDFGAKFSYCADFTRTFGKTPAENAIIKAVRTVKKRTIAFAKPDKTLLQVHKFACAQILAQLIALNILNGTSTQLQKAEVIKAFFPHFIGHHVGLSVHDYGSKDTKLKKNMVITIEPGIYFIKSLYTNEKYTKFINTDVLATYIPVHGVRDEDTIIL